MLTLEQAQSHNAAAFILHNNIVNENGHPITFDYHPFLAKPYMDESPRIVVRKASQVGFSTLAIIRALHMAKFLKANIIYTLPSKAAVKDFVSPKIDPLINKNPALKSFVGFKDTTDQKLIGDRFVYFRSAWDESKAISISADILIQDEVNFSNPKVLQTYESRLHGSEVNTRHQDRKLGWVWKFSNPTVTGEGVDKWWQESDQKHWFIKCSRCNKYQYLDFPDNIDLDSQIFICKECKRPLSQEDRLSGKWIPMNPGADISGYWMNRLMAPWVKAPKLIEEFKEDPAFFTRFSLGKPYESAEDKVTRAMVLDCVYQTHNPQEGVAMGVDVGRVKHYVIGNTRGIFRVGHTEDWDEIEELKLRYNAKMVIDANPHGEKALSLAHKFRGDVWVNYVNLHSKDGEIVRWGQATKEKPNDDLICRADRTKLLDLVAREVSQQLILFNTTESELDNWSFINHLENMYRTIEENKQGLRIPVWRTIEGRPDHFFLALAYWRLALMRTVTHGEIVRGQSRKTVMVATEQGDALDTEAILDMIERRDKSRSWKSI